MDKNVENPLNNKYLLSLGEDEIIDQSSGAVAQKALVFKIWDFISLDNYSSKTGITGGNIWDKNPNDQSG